MLALTRPLFFFSQWTRRLGTCGNAGLIAGGLSGGVLSIVHWGREGELAPNAWQLLAIVALLTAFAALTLLFVFVGLLRMPFGRVLVPILVNALLVVVLTVAFAELLGAYALAWLIGLLVGIVIGTLLCSLARGDKRRQVDGLH